MEKIELSDRAFKAIMDRLKNIEAAIHTKQTNLDDVFLDNQEFLQLMYISKRTAQSWRNEGVIAYSQIGNKIYYRMSDIVKMLEEHRQPSRSGINATSKS